MRDCGSGVLGKGNRGYEDLYVSIVVPAYCRAEISNIRSCAVLLGGAHTSDALCYAALRWKRGQSFYEVSLDARNTEHADIASIIVRFGTCDSSNNHSISARGNDTEKFIAIMQWTWLTERLQKSKLCCVFT